MAQNKATLHINAHEQLHGDLNYSRSGTASRTNSIGNIESVASGVIRYDYYSDPDLIGIPRGYLLEESSENVCLQTEDFSTTWATTAGTLTNIGSITTNAASVLAPDGSFTADLLSAGSSATGIVAARQTGFTFSDSGKYTVSVWAKAGDHDYVELSNKDNSASGRTYAQTFNLSTGATGASGGTVDASGMEKYHGGWYRCYATFTGSSSDGEFYIKSRSDNAVSTETAMTSGHGIYIWGAQIENKAYRTSYIPVTTVAVSRTADVCTISDSDDKWNWNAGVSLYVDYMPLNTTETVTPIYHYSDATNQNYMTALSDGDIKVYSGNSTQLSTNVFDTGMATTSEIQ